MRPPNAWLLCWSCGPRSTFQTCRYCTSRAPIAYMATKRSTSLPFPLSVSSLPLEVR